MPLIGSMVTCCLWAIFSWHWVWTRSRFPVPEQFSVAVSGMYRFKGLVLSTMNRLFLSCMKEVDPESWKSSLQRKQALDFHCCYWKALAIKSDYMKCLLVSNWGENNFNIPHSAGGVLHNNAYSHYSAEVVKLFLF